MEEQEAKTYEQAVAYCAELRRFESRAFRAAHLADPDQREHAQEEARRALVERRAACAAVGYVFGLTEAEVTQDAYDRLFGRE